MKHWGLCHRHHWEPPLRRNISEWASLIPNRKTSPSLPDTPPPTPAWGRPFSRTTWPKAWNKDSLNSLKLPSRARVRVCAQIPVVSCWVGGPARCFHNLPCCLGPGAIGGQGNHLMGWHRPGSKVLGGGVADRSAAPTDLWGLRDSLPWHPLHAVFPTGLLHCCTKGGGLFLSPSTTLLPPASPQVWECAGASSYRLVTANCYIFWSSVSWLLNVAIIKN